MRGFQPAKAKAKAQPFASGGQVRGPGTGTSKKTQSYADGGLVNPLSGVGEYWSNSNAEFEAQNPNLLQRGVRAINPVTGFGSAVGAMHDGANVGSARDMAIAALQAAPVFGAMRAVAPAVKSVAGAAPAVLAPSVAKTAARGAKGTAAGVAADEAQAQNFANGGMVRGPGTGTSDDIKTSVPAGTYIMPADSTAAVGEQALATAGARGFTPGGGEKVPVNLSNGEFKLPPEQVHALGVQALDQIKNATHTPAARGFSPGKKHPVEEQRFFFADGGVVKDEEKKQAGVSLVNQIPTNGNPPAPAPDGKSDTELSRNVNNSLNALGGMGVVSSVPLRQPPTSTALATIPPAAGFAPGALAKTGELATAAAPQAAQAARGLPGTIAGLQEGAQANAYAAAGRALGGASAGATALDNNRPADPMAPPPPKVNSFGDAAAVARGASAALPSAGALSMGTAPQAAPQVTTPEARKAVGLFPYSSPDAGANIYAGVGFGKGGEQQAAGAAPQATPPDPMAAHNQKLEAAQGLQSWRRSQGASSSPAARQNYLDLQQKAVDMQPSYFTQEGPLSAQNRAAAESAASSALQSMYTQKPPAAASAPASNPYASVTPEEGRAMAEINAGAPQPGQPQPQPQPNGQPPEGRDMGGGVTRIDRPGHSPLFTDNKDPDMARFLARPAGGPTKEVSDIMQRMSDKSQNEAFSRFQKEANAAQYSREVQQAQAANAAGGENARNVQNRMDQEKYLRKLDIKASSAGSLIERMAAQKTYNEALAQDAGFRAGADAGSVARTQNEGSSARERMQQAGATERVQMQEAGQNSRADQTQDLAQQKFGMEREAQGFQTRAAAQQEQLRNVLLDPNATPEQKDAARQSTQLFSGLSEQWKAIATSGGKDEFGNTLPGGALLYNPATGESRAAGGQQQGGAQPLPPGMKRQVGTSNGRPVYEDMNGKQVIAKG